MKSTVKSRGRGFVNPMSGSARVTPARPDTRQPRNNGNKQGLLTGPKKAS